MQGIIACPFYAPTIRAQQQCGCAEGAPTPLLGVADSLLLHLWEAHPSAHPPFVAIRVHPIRNAPSWRARVVRVPFLRDWYGNRFDPTSAAEEEAS